MKCFAAIALIVLAALSPARAEDTAWHDGAGEDLPDTPARRSIDGFGGWLYPTADREWRAKWDGAPGRLPEFEATTTVKRGQPLSVLILLIRPGLGEGDQADVRCDLRITRPDGSVAGEAPGVACLSGVQYGADYSVRLAAPVIEFVGEAKDPAGEWVVEASLKDVVRGKTLALRTVLTLRDGE